MSSTKRSRRFVILAAGFLILAIWQWERARRAAPALEKAVSELQNREEQIRAVKGREEDFREELERHGARIAELDLALPLELDPGSFETELREWAGSHGAELESLTAGESKSLDFHREQSLTGVLIGPEPALVALTSHREQLVRAVRWDRVETEGERASLRLSIFAWIPQPGGSPTTVCSELAPFDPPAALWPFGRRTAELRDDCDRLCNFEEENAEISLAIETLTLRREEILHREAVLRQLVGWPEEEELLLPPES